MPRPTGAGEQATDGAVSARRPAPSGGRSAAFAVALLATAFGAGWQFLTVHYNYGGDWTALFCAGRNLALPAELQREDQYRFPRASGYDGQYYHLIAHDPCGARGFGAYVDSPRLRYRRILVPGLAFLLAGGRDDLVDASYVVEILAWVFLGAWWIARYAVAHGSSPAWGLGFLLLPSTIVGLDRMVVDIAMTALTAAFALYAGKERQRHPWVVCALAALARETGLLLASGAVLALCVRRRWRSAVAFATAAVPALLWFALVQARTAGAASGIAGPRPIASYPAEWVVHALLNPTAYAELPAGLAAAAVGLDRLSVCGAFLAMLMALAAFARAPSGFVEAAGLAYALLALAVAGTMGWQEPFGFTRVMSPLFLLLALRAVRGGPWWAAAPALMTLPRIGLQLGPQVLGILDGMFQPLSQNG